MIKRKDIIHLGIRSGPAKNPWYLTISDAVRKEVQLPYHHRLRVRMSPGSSPIILSVKSYEQAAATEDDDILLPIRVQKNKQGIVLGPILAILTMGRQDTGTFGGNRSNFIDIIKMGQRMGLAVVVVTPEGLGRPDTMDCFLYTSQSGKTVWRKAMLPLPSVVYNRVFGREKEHTPEVNRAKRFLSDQGIPLFNHGFFDKRELHDLLSQDSEVAKFLPETERFTDEQQLLNMLGRHQMVYVKPIDGYAGDGIMQVRKERDGYAVTYQNNGKRTRKVFRQSRSAARAVFKKIRGQGYLLQQGIPLATYLGRHYDLRLLAQKLPSGKWSVTGIGSRVADSDGITTHVPNGGQVESAENTLKASFGAERAATILERVRKMALLVAKLLDRREEQLGHHFGEVSMDIGVGVDGSIWFFEANSKPGKFDEPKIRELSLVRLLEYCEFLVRTR